MSLSGAHLPTAIEPAAAGAHASWLANHLGDRRIAPLDPTDLTELVGSLVPTLWAGGTSVFSRGDPPTRVHIVRRGSVELSRGIGGRQVGVLVVQAGGVIGDIALLTRRPHSLDARMVEDGMMLTIEAAPFVRALGRRPHLAHRWLSLMAIRLAEMEARVRDLLAGSLLSQVASLLLRRESGGAVELSQAMIAELLGANRSSVNRVLKQLEAAGTISVAYRRVEVVDHQRLAVMAGTGPGDA